MWEAHRNRLRRYNASKAHFGRWAYLPPTVPDSHHLHEDKYSTYKIQNRRSPSLLLPPMYSSHERGSSTCFQPGQQPTWESSQPRLSDFSERCSFRRAISVVRRASTETVRGAEGCAPYSTTGKEIIMINDDEWLVVIDPRRHSPTMSGPVGPAPTGPTIRQTRTTPVSPRHTATALLN